MDNAIYSIGIPTKNRADLLAELLSSMVAFGVKVPVVISDNNSTDHTQEVIISYSDRLNIVHIRQQYDLSIAQNFNAVLRNVTTKYLMFISDDDLLLPYSASYYTSLVNLLERDHRDMLAVYVNRCIFSTSDQYKSILDRLNWKSFSADSLKVFDVNEYILHTAKVGDGGHQPGMVLNMEIVEGSNLYFFDDGGNYLDKLYFINGNRFHKVAYHSQRAVCYRVYEGNTMKMQIDDHNRLFIKKIEEIIPNKKIVKNIKKIRLVYWCLLKRDYSFYHAYTIARELGVGLLSFIRIYFIKVFRMYLSDLKKGFIKRRNSRMLCNDR